MLTCLGPLCPPVATERTARSTQAASGHWCEARWRPQHWCRAIVPTMRGSGADPVEVGTCVLDPVFRARMLAGGTAGRPAACAAAVAPDAVQQQDRPTPACVLKCAAQMLPSRSRGARAHTVARGLDRTHQCSSPLPRVSRQSPLSPPTGPNSLECCAAYACAARRAMSRSTRATSTADRGSGLTHLRTVRGLRSLPWAIDPTSMSTPVEKYTDRRRESAQPVSVVTAGRDRSTHLPGPTSPADHHSSTLLKMAQYGIPKMGVDQRGTRQRPTATRSAYPSRPRASIRSRLRPTRSGE